ncbi:MAG: dTMP kinase [Candidatus Omnitrophota bacterium]|nr:dTMP kinase [Candidatus Omnitrophota bacterium]
MAEEIEQGIFITFEGPEGSGKSTHSRRVYEELLSDGFDAVHTAEPGGTALGRGIRDLLLEKDEIRLDSQAELFLFEADRAQHVEEFIRPQLRMKKVVICDRYSTATFAYQGYGLGTDIGFIERVDAAATGGLCPDLTVLLDVDVETGLARAGAGRPADRIEKRNRQFHEKVRRGYLSLAEKFPDRIKVIEVRDNRDETYNLVKEEVYALIERYKRSK